MPQSNSQPQPQRFAPAPGFATLQQYIHAAAAAVITASSTTTTSSSDRSSLYHLVIAIFTAARSAVRVLSAHYQSRPHALTPDLRARLDYCALRLKAIFYTLCHAPQRFFSAAQFRALTRARAVLAHIWNQSVDFNPLIPWLTAPENCPPPPRWAVAPEVAPASCRHSSQSTPLRTPRSAPRASSDPLLLQNPGRALTAVLSQLAAIYGVAPKPVAVPRTVTCAPAPSAAPSTSTADSPSSAPASPAPDPAAVPGLSAAATGHPQSPCLAPSSTLRAPP